MGKKPIRILLFEDEAESMQYLKEYLEEDFGWSVEMTAEVGVLDRLKKEKFDLIVVDLMIHPEMDTSPGESIRNVHYDGVNYKGTGLEFIRHLRAGEYSSQEGTDKDVPVVVISAFSDSVPEFKDDHPLSKISFFYKPFLLHELVAELKKLI
jgi:CheY-like chemotaxis protein